MIPYISSKVNKKINQALEIIFRMWFNVIVYAALV